jgi:hypothetical protein
MAETADAVAISSSAIGLAWWNTGLSPSSAPGRASEGELETACDMLEVLCRLRHHFIALGEITVADFDAIRAQATDWLHGYELEDGNVAVGRGKFDTLVLYRPDAIALTTRRDLVNTKVGRTARLGQHFAMVCTADSTPLHLIVSHWPSRLTLHEDVPDRIEFGHRLRDKVDDLLSGDSSANVVLLGDYNDEPFDDAISQALRATRDKKFVHRRPDLLYNPFWRHLSSYECAQGEEQTSDAGTYFHGKGFVTRWRTFDHMMFSSSLVRGAGGWQLDERRTRVLNIPMYTEMVEARRHVFDHLPITSWLLRSN